MRFRKKVDYEGLLVELLPWVHDQGDVLAGKPNCDYFEVSTQFDELGFVERHEY